VRPRNDFSDVDDLVIGTEYISLECACPNGGCRRTLEESLAYFCSAESIATGRQVTRVSGCGLTQILGVSPDDMQPFTGPDPVGEGDVFDPQSGALVGVVSWRELAESPCHTPVQLGGVEFDCPAAETCQLCGTPLPSVPPCEP
jgi:hypothetical protein